MYNFSQFQNKILAKILFLADMAVCDCAVSPASGQTLAALCGGSQFMLFMGLLEVFIRSQCDLEDPCNRPRVSKLFKISRFSFELKFRFSNFSHSKVAMLKMNTILLLLEVGPVVPWLLVDCQKCLNGKCCW